MNFEKLWNDRKLTLLDTIAAGKKAELDIEKNGYSSDLYSITRKGSDALEELLAMVHMELEQYLEINAVEEESKDE